MASAKKDKMVLCQEQSLQFISDVQDKPILWSKRCPAYKNVYQQNDIWSELGPKYGMDLEGAKRYWQSLRSTFRSNHSKVKASTVTGTSSSSVFVPSWYAYSAMCFLRETSDVGHTVDSLDGDLTSSAPTTTPAAEPQPQPSTSFRSRSPHPPYRIPLPTQAERRPCPRIASREDPLADTALRTIIDMMESIRKRNEEPQNGFFMYLKEKIAQRREEDVPAIEAALLGVVNSFPLRSSCAQPDMPQCSGIAPTVNVEYEEEYLDTDSD